MRGLVAQAATNRLLAVLVEALPPLQANLALLTRDVGDATGALKVIEQHANTFRKHATQGQLPLAKWRALLPHLRAAKQSCTAYGQALDAAIEALERP